MEQIDLRLATLGDLPEIVNLFADDELGSAREAPGMPLDPRYLKAFADIQADPNQLLIVATDQRQVIGTLQISLIPGLNRKGALRGQIESVQVSTHRRGQGIGRHMLSWAIAECDARGCQIIQLTTDKRRPRAHRFYETIGFAATHEGYKISKS